MAGRVEGGLKAAKTNRARHGADFYMRIGALGGKKGKVHGVIKGFAAMKPEKQRAASVKGGLASRRYKGMSW
jgi:hypothetical protein